MLDKKQLAELQEEGITKLLKLREEIAEAVDSRIISWAEVESINRSILLKTAENQLIRKAFESSEQQLVLRLHDNTTDLIHGISDTKQLVITQGKAKILRLILEIKRPV